MRGKFSGLIFGLHKCDRKRYQNQRFMREWWNKPPSDFKFNWVTNFTGF